MYENAGLSNTWVEKYNDGYYEHEILLSPIISGKTTLKRIIDKLRAKEQENKKLKQALDEIEKQVRAINNECFYNDICDCNNCDMKGGCSHYRKSIILDIINKAKER